MFRILRFIILLVLSTSLYGQVNELVSEDQDLNLSPIKVTSSIPNFSYLEDRSQDQTNIEKNGFTTNYYWYRLEITNRTNLESWNIMTRVFMDHVVLMSKKNDSVQLEESGSIIPHSKRSVLVRKHTVKLEVLKNESRVVYLGLRFGFPYITNKINIVSQSVLNEHKVYYGAFSSLFLGIAVVLLLYNLFFYLNDGDRVFLFYMTFVVVSTVAVLIITTPVTFLVGDLIGPIPDIMRLTQLSVTFSASFFFYYFLKLYRYPKPIKLIAQGLIVSMGLALLLAPQLPLAFMKYFNFLSPVTVLFFLCCTFQPALRGDRPTQIYLLGILTAASGVIVKELFHRGLIDSVLVGSWAAIMGVAGEMIFMSLAIGQRIRERIGSLVSDLRKSEEGLQEKVQQRTQELNERNQQLESEVKERIRAEQVIKEQQQLLVDSEKMNSLGQVAAGLAHEINNPLAILSGYSQQINVKAKKGLKEGDTPQVQMMAERMVTTVNRISKIVRSLRSYARNGDEDPFLESEFKSIFNGVMEQLDKDIQQNHISLECNFSEENYPLSCREEQVSLVLNNLIKNAIDAVSETDSKWIKVKLWKEEQFLHLEVIDSGPGVPEELKSKIFDPFFTSKEVGKGAGLGLSISKGIVEDHGGMIKVTEIDGHTCFHLGFPLLVDRKSQAFG